MERITAAERPDWQATAERMGLTFHHLGGERYWDERAYYRFTLDEVEERIEGPSGGVDRIGETATTPSSAAIAARTSAIGAPWRPRRLDPIPIA